MITVTSEGSFDNIEKALRKMSKLDVTSILEKCGQQGVIALSSATPKRTGETANVWSYEVTHKLGLYSIFWKNDHIEEGVPVAILLQYGHATGTGGYVQGKDYINPAIKPIFDQIAEEVWKVVKQS